MIHHYLLAALRNLRRTPVVTAITVLTLSLGIACFVATYGFVGFWRDADRQFSNADRIFVVTSRFEARGGRFAARTLPTTNHYVAQYLRADFPAIEAVARIAFLEPDLALAAGERSTRLFAAAADPGFLAIFDLPFVAGDGRNALREPKSVVLTREGAMRLFGREDVLGRSVLLANAVEGTVTGVIDRIPEPSHMGHSWSAPLPFDVLTSRDVFELLQKKRFGKDTTEAPENWMRTGNITYVLLPAGGTISAESLRGQLADFTVRHAPADQLARTRLELGLAPVSDILGLRVSSTGFIPDTGMSLPELLWLLSGLILAVACVNFANLATARAASRTQDVGMRKAIGAKGSQVLAQHLVEAGLTTGAGLLLALVFVGAVAPTVQNSLGIDLVGSVLGQPSVWLFLAGLVAVVTLTAGGYTALILSRIRPLAALRPSSLGVGPRRLSPWLVGVQFAVASFLLVAVVVTYLQNRALRQAALYSEPDPLLVIEDRWEETGLAPETLRRELLRLPEVKDATAMDPRPWLATPAISELSASPEESAGLHGALMYWVQEKFFATLDIGLIAGRVFSPERADDDSVPWTQSPGQIPHIVIDRAMSRSLGFGTPEAAVGQLVYLHSVNLQRAGPAPQPWRVIGVVDNKAASLSSIIGGAPSVYRYFSAAMPNQIVRISGTDVPSALGDIDRLWRHLAPNVPIKRRFLDEYFEDSYRTFSALNGAISLLAGFALLIATSGLIAMALIVVRRTLPELAVRRVIGAKSSQVVALLLRRFLTPVLIGSALAWPLAYYLARRYVQLFVTPIELGSSPFVLSLLFALLLTLLAVGGQTWIASRRMPSAVLRNE